MPRPLRASIGTGAGNWNTTLNDNLAALFDTPTPTPEVVGLIAADIETAHPAAQYAGCLVTLNVAGVYSLYFSDGTTWLLK